LLVNMAGSLTDEERNLRLMKPLSKYAAWQFSSIHRFIRGEVLEVGGGIGTISAAVAGMPEVSSLTITETNPNNRSRLSRSLGKRSAISAEDISVSVPGPFRSGFDTVIAVNVMEHIEDDERFFRNCCACLKPGGRLLVLVPAMRFLFGTLDAADSHKRRYEKNDLLALASDNGLALLRLRYMNLPGALGWYYHGKVLGLRVHRKGDLSVFEFFVPLFRALESIIPPPFGLSLVLAAERR
jgi:SAM-dependent methyltransferase